PDGTRPYPPQPGPGSRAGGAAARRAGPLPAGVGPVSAVRPPRWAGVHVERGRLATEPDRRPPPGARVVQTGRADAATGRGRAGASGRRRGPREPGRTDRRGTADAVAHRVSPPRFTAVGSPVISAPYQ